MTFREMVEERIQQHEMISVYSNVPGIGLITYDFPAENIFDEVDNKVTIEGKNGAVTVPLAEEPVYDETDDTYGFINGNNSIWIG